jgi:hypothetical protein
MPTSGGQSGQSSSKRPAVGGSAGCSSSSEDNLMRQARAAQMLAPRLVKEKGSKELLDAVKALPQKLSPVLVQVLVGAQLPFRVSLG